MLLVRDQGETLRKKGTGLYREKTKTQDRFKSSHHSCWFQNVTENSRRFWKVYIWLCHSAGLVFLCLLCVFLFCSQAVLKPFFFQQTAIKRNFSHRDKNVYQNESTKYTARKWKHESEIAQNEPGLFSCNFKGAGIREQTWAQGKKTRKKEDFLVSFWSSPMLDFALLQVEHLHLCAQPITYLIAVFFPCFSLFFKAREWVQVELALSQCFEFLWHASGKSEDRRGTPGC